MRFENLQCINDGSACCALARSWHLTVFSGGEFNGQAGGRRCADLDQAAGSYLGVGCFLSAFASSCAHPPGGSDYGNASGS